MPRLVGRLVLSYAPESMIIAALRPCAGLAPPRSGDLSEVPSTSYQPGVGRGGVTLRGVTPVRLVRLVHLSIVPPLSPSSQSVSQDSLSCPQPEPTTKFLCVCV